MKKLQILFVFCALGLALPSVAFCSDNFIDTAAVIKIAKRHNAYWTKNWAMQPSISFDSTKGEWKIVSYKSKHTNKGDCKNTNGCTEIKTVVLIIDNKTKKVKSREETKQLMPNYE